MTPFFFGASSHPLYGVYHPPLNQPAQKEGVLLCPPFGQEYMRSHRANRQLALLLTKKGFPVLRFDYRGTGDSSGEIEDICISDWLSDIRTAAEELKATANIDRIHLIGLRLGGLLATLAADDALPLESLILWDPVVSGQSYDEELQHEMNKEGASKCNHIDEQGTLHFNGFPLHRKVRDELHQLSLLEASPSAKKILHVVSHEYPKSNELKKSWANKSGYHYQHTPAPGDWSYVDEYGGILLPQPVIQEITTWIAQ